MTGGPGPGQGSVRIWLRIGLATVVVAALAVITDNRDSETATESLAPSDGRAGSVRRCGVSEAKRVAQVWFRGMSSGEAKRVRAVTSGGKPVPRYVITINEGGRSRTVRIPGRTSATETIPELIEATDTRGSLKIEKVGNPPGAADIRSPLLGRLAGIQFSARVGDTKWSGKAGVRCGNDTAYFAAFEISDR